MIPAAPRAQADDAPAFRPPLGRGLRPILRRLAAWAGRPATTVRALAEERLLHRIVTENAADLIVRMNRERRRIYVSPSCRELGGYTQEEMLGGSAFALVHADDLPGVLALFAAIGPDNPLQEATWRIRRKDGSDVSTMLRSADIAMYHAKRSATGGFRFFAPGMGAELAELAELRNELSHAIAAGEITPYFQPLIRFDDGALAGFEVLARWEHPTKGTLPPARFLPLAAEAGLLGAMQEAVLRQACLAARDRPEALRLAINLSPRELQDAGLPARVQAILHASGFAGERLEIEIAENVLIHDSQVPRAVLAALRALGCRIALGGFGAGYSHLLHLCGTMFDKIKIDRSFTPVIDQHANGARYVAAIVELGRALGLEVTAEGIEDEATMRRLRDLGCTYGQGFLFGKPLPARETRRLLAEG